MNGARCFIDDFEYVTRKDNTLKLKRIWVVFPEPGTGSLLREDCKRKGITNKNPLAVPISEIKESFEIPRIRIKVTRTQFPLVVCFCMTSYKSQGQTLEAVILDFQEAIAKHGHFYVGVTRVRNSGGLFVKNFKPSQVLCRDDVKKQILILRKTKNYKFSKTYLDTKIWDSPIELRVGYININGLFHKINYLDKDYNIRNLDYLCIAETKLDNSILDDQIDQINSITKGIFDSFTNGGKILIAGNGGSNSDAEHFAGELTCTYKNSKRIGFPAISLGNNSSAITRPRILSPKNSNRSLFGLPTFFAEECVNAWSNSFTFVNW